MQIVNRCMMVAGFCALIGCGEDTGTSSAGSTGGGSTTEVGTSGTSGTSSSETGTTVTPTGGGETEGQTTGPTPTTGPSPTTGPETGTSDTGGESSSSGGPGPVCGDGVVEVGVEACDGADLGGQTCADLGFDGGELGCVVDTCMHDTAACTACGDGEVDPGEGCDDGNVVAGDGCDAACQLEACDPDGPWKVEGAPIAYTCCVGLVNLNITGFLFASDGATISSSPSNPIAMTGAATSCPVGKFSNQGQIAGGCTETFKLEGDFVDANTWKGTYTVGFQGEQCSCFQGMLGAPCINQAFPVTATR